MSTQASVRNIEGVKYFAKQNIDRVVLAREMNICEIEEICHNCSIDIEVFVHGALCMSYSGQCLMSSMIANAKSNTLTPPGMDFPSKASTPTAKAISVAVGTAQPSLASVP